MLPLIFIAPSTVTPFPEAKQLIDSKINSNEMVLKTDKLGLIISPIQEQFEKDKIENEKKKAEELKLQKVKEIEEQKKNEIQWQEFELTFYSSSISENSSAGAVTCQGNKLEPYMIANNVYSLGTQIYLEGYGTKTVSARGSDKHFSTSKRLDVFIEKEPNENYIQYLKRVNNDGVRKVRGSIIK